MSVDQVSPGSNFEALDGSNLKKRSRGSTIRASWLLGLKQGFPRR